MSPRTVADVMKAGVISITDEAPLAEAIDQMQQRKVSALVVVDHSGHMVGLISQTDLLRAWRKSASDADVMQRPVGDYMTRDVISCAPYKSLDYAMRLLDEHQIRRLVVVETHDGGRFMTDRMMPVGVLSQTDIVRALIGTLEDKEVEQTGV